MYASVAGLRAHMQKLTVIGNNVANVNTQGYKKQRTVFRDSIYSLYSGGSNGTSTVGGMNPSQLGYGAMIGSIDLNMSSASYNPGNPTDCALVGDGFFLVGDKETVNSINPKDPDSFKALTLTRVGDFKFGPDGYLVDGKGNVVYGFMNVNSTTTGTGYNADGSAVEGCGFKTGPDGKPIANISDQLVPIRLPHWQKMPTKVPATDDEDNTDFVDSYRYEIRYARTMQTGEDADGTTEIALYDDDKVVTGEDNDQVETPLEFAKFSSISIDAGTGAITGVCQEGDQVVTIGYIAIGSVTNPNGVTHVGNSYYKCMEGAGDLGISMLGGVNKDLGIWNVNSYMGKTEGENGATTVDLPAGSEITGSGDTEMMTGFLESPNTDLAEEITELITTQRGYQANTRIITVTDSMLEELVNMKR